MKQHVRTALAYIAAKLATDNPSNSIFDFTAGQYTQFSGTVSPTAVNIFDYSRSAQIGGSPQSLFHYGDGHYISLNMEGPRFSGFDYGTSTHFSGTVNVGSVSLFDYGEGKYFQFSI